MKATLNGIVYDTDTAERLADVTHTHLTCLQMAHVSMCNLYTKTAMADISCGWKHRTMTMLCR